MPIFLHSKSTGYGAYEKDRITAPRLESIIENPAEIVGKIPAAYRRDFYFSMAETKQPRRGQAPGESLQEWEKWTDNNWIRQTFIPFDIDPPKIKDSEGKVIGYKELDMSRLEEYIQALADIVKTAPENITVNNSGHGLHLYLHLKTPITDWRFFSQYKPYYSALCTKIEKIIWGLGLNGELDRGIFDHGRIMRLPCTLNTKRENHVEARSLQKSLYPHIIEFDSLLELPPPDIKESASQKEYKFYKKITPDVQGIFDQCNFMRHVRDNPTSVKEPEGHKALQLLRFMDPTKKLAKELYATWTNSTSLMETPVEVKLDYLERKDIGPPLCDTMAALKPNLCEGCKVRCKTPLTLKSPLFIESESNGFHTIHRSGNGTTAKETLTPNQSDLLKAFRRDHHYVYQTKGSTTWSFQGSHYEELLDIQVKAYSERKFKPDVKEHIRQEFLSKVRVNYQLSEKECDHFFRETLKNRVNLRNGVLNTETLELEPHSPDYGFRYTLPYDYDPAARAPLFERYLHEVTLHRPNLQKMLLDFMGALFVPGYRDFGAAFWFLIGQGRNGKSTFTDLCKALVGDPSTIYLKSTDIAGDSARFRLAGLDGKLLCVMEEVGDKKISTPLMGMLKDLSAGGTITVEKKGKDPYSATNAAKILLLFNNVPLFDENNTAVKSRSRIIHFDVNLDDPNSPYQMIQGFTEALLKELPGIFNMALAARKELLARGHAFRPKESDDAINQILLESDGSEEWFQDSCELAPGSMIPVDEAYAHYLGHCQGDNPMSRRTFSARIRAKIGMRKGSERRYIGNSQVRVFIGIRLADRGPSLQVDEKNNQNT